MEGTLHISTHPVIAHKLSKLRSASTSSQNFRHLLHEITMYIGYETTASLPTQSVDIKTPIATTKGFELSDRIALVPIMRAGLGMVDSMLDLLPNSAVHHIGMYRDKKSLLPIVYYNKLPAICNADVAIVLEPMIASGATLHATITILKSWGCKKIIIMSVVGCKEGVEFLRGQHPDVSIYLAAVDSTLTKSGSISPGLGDIGDRYFDNLAHAETEGAESPAKKKQKTDK